MVKVNNVLSYKIKNRKLGKCRKNEMATNMDKILFWQHLITENSE